MTMVPFIVSHARTLHNRMVEWNVNIDILSKPAWPCFSTVMSQHRFGCTHSAPLFILSIVYPHLSCNTNLRLRLSMVGSLRMKIFTLSGAAYIHTYATTRITNYLHVVYRAHFLGIVLNTKGIGVLNLSHLVPS